MFHIRLCVSVVCHVLLFVVVGTSVIEVFFCVGIVCLLFCLFVVACSCCALVLFACSVFAFFFVLVCCGVVVCLFVRYGWFVYFLCFALFRFRMLVFNLGVVGTCVLCWCCLFVFLCWLCLILGLCVCCCLFFFRVCVCCLRVPF